MSLPSDEPDPGQALRIEVGRVSQTRCDRCGRAAVHTTGFVYRGGDAHAIYHGTLHGHGAPQVDLAIGIGTWDTDSAVAEVSAFLAVTGEAQEITFGFVEPLDSIWSDRPLLRNQLSAAEARSSSSRKDLLRVAEAIVRDDPAVAGHLGPD
jgi:hypothetical protein